MAMCPNNGNPDRHDQTMAQRSRASICQRTVGEHLSASGGFITQLTGHAIAENDDGRLGRLCETPLWACPELAEGDPHAV